MTILYHCKLNEKAAFVWLYMDPKYVGSVVEATAACGAQKLLSALHWCDVVTT